MVAAVAVVFLAFAARAIAEPAVAERPLPERRPNDIANGPIIVAVPRATVDSPAAAEIPNAPKESAPETNIRAATPAEVSVLIAELNHSDATVRRLAMLRLSASGPEAVEALLKAGRDGSLEQRVRAVQALREIYVNGREDTVDSAEKALDELVADLNASVSSRAEAVLSRHYDIREKRAIAQIERLGGIITYQEDPFVDPNTGEPSDSKIVSHVILGKDWKAGDEGLKVIRRLTRLRMVYYIPDSGVTEGGLKDLQAAIPNLLVQRRGRACLGVAGVSDPAGRGCQVMRVIENSAAARAKFQVGDVVMTFNGKEVTDFDKLIDLIGTTKPGDKIKVEVLRGFQNVTLEPVMDEWKQ